jgi:hypothetical protein
MYNLRRYVIVKGDDKIVQEVIDIGVDPVFSAGESRAYIADCLACTMISMGINGESIEVPPILEYEKGEPFASALIPEGLEEEDAEYPDSAEA